MSDVLASLEMAKENIWFEDLATVLSLRVDCHWLIIVFLSC